MKEEITKKLENSRGITLVALVITIIILIILVGITLKSVFEDEGIFKRAQGSTIEHRAGEVEDEVKLWRTEKQISKYEPGSLLNRSELIESQKSRGLLTEEEAETVKTTGKVKIGTKIIEYGEE